jgi:hypothetical protein
MSEPGLFDDLPRGGSGLERQKPSKIVDRAACGKCLGEQVPVVYGNGRDHLVWRDHTYETWAGIKMPCQASGQRLCDVPPRHVEFVKPPQCRHLA